MKDSIIINYYCTPRQSGKTTIGMYEAMKNPNHLFLAHNNGQALQISYDSNNHIKTATYDSLHWHGQALFQSSKGTQIQTLILDEYLYAKAKDKQAIYNFILSSMAEGELREVYVFSTPQYQISKEIHDYIASLKAAGVQFEDVTYRKVRLDNPKWFYLPHDVHAIMDFIKNQWYDLMYIDTELRNLGKVKLNFFDGDNRVPFFDYRKMTKHVTEDDFFFYKPAEVTGQYIVK